MLVVLDLLPWEGAMEASVDCMAPGLILALGWEDSWWCVDGFLGWFQSGHSNGWRRLLESGPGGHAELHLEKFRQVFQLLLHLCVPLLHSGQ